MGTLFYFQFVSLFKFRTTLKENNLLLLEQILSFKISPFGRVLLSREASQEVTKVISLCKIGGNKQNVSVSIYITLTIKVMFLANTPVLKEQANLFPYSLLKQVCSNSLNLLSIQVQEERIKLILFGW